MYVSSQVRGQKDGQWRDIPANPSPLSFLSLANDQQANASSACRVVVMLGATLEKATGSALKAVEHRVKGGG